VADVPNTISASQHLERVIPLVPQEARYAPEHTQRFDRTGGSDASAVEGLPSQLADDFGSLAFRAGVVAAQEHGGSALLIVRVYHLGTAYAIEGFHDMAARYFGLKSFGERLIRARGKRQYAIDGWGVCQARGSSCR
jgi:hypothetical protein